MSIILVGLFRKDPANILALLRDGPTTTSFVFSMTGPIGAISAPHSFWSKFGSNPIAARTVLDMVRALFRGDLDLASIPVEVQFDQEPTTPEPVWAKATRYRPSDEHLKWAIEYLTVRGDTSLFPRPFEYAVITKSSEDALRLLQHEDMGEGGLRPFRQTLVPKSSGGMRVGTQLDPQDTILLTALVRENGEILEKARVPVGENVVHGFRFSEAVGPRLWSRNADYSTFEDATTEQAKHHAFVVETDISSFYHQLDKRNVANIIERIGVARKTAEALCRKLASFPDNGIPVGPAFSAFLAEATLNDVDHLLLSSGITYVRFHDDFRLFCRTETEARAAIQVLATALWSTSRLVLQDAKTKIIPSSLILDKQATRSEWLTELQTRIREHEYAHSNEDLPEHERHLAESASAVLKTAIADEHVAYLKLFRSALRALPSSGVMGHLPEVFSRLNRLWPASREIALAAVRAVHGSDERQSTLETTLFPVFAHLPEIPPNSLAWLIWMLYYSTPNSQQPILPLTVSREPIVARELILALGPDGHVMPSLLGDAGDAWLLRSARLIAPRQQFEISRPKNPADSWEAFLLDCIAQSGYSISRRLPADAK